MYKYETHLHTREGSACASASGEQMAIAHKDMGYDGIFITDHFFNANTAVPRDLPWEQRVDLFFKGYENARETGDKIGLKVWFGLEYSVHGADFLIYNMDKEFMKDNENLLMHCDERKVFQTLRALGCFVVHAHPFRTADYIHHINLYPFDVDAVEVINASHRSNVMFNERAKLYADSYALIKTGGSDSHHLDRLFGGGILTSEPINEPPDYLRLLKEGKVIPIDPENTYPKGFKTVS